MLRLFVLSCVLLLSHGQVPETDVITCDLKDCNYMCVCQKLVWTTDFNHPILGGSTGAFYMYPHPLPRGAAAHPSGLATLYGAALLGTLVVCRGMSCVALKNVDAFNLHTHAHTPALFVPVRPVPRANKHIFRHPLVAASLPVQTRSARNGRRTLRFPMKNARRGCVESSAGGGSPWVWASVGCGTVF